MLSSALCARLSASSLYSFVWVAVLGRDATTRQQVVIGLTIHENVETFTAFKSCHDYTGVDFLLDS